MPNPPIFDGHNDVLTRLHEAGGLREVKHFVKGSTEGHIDLPRAKEGGFGGGFFAVYVPSADVDFEAMLQEMQKSEYHLKKDESVSWTRGAKIAMAQMAILHKMEDKGALTVCTSTAVIEECLTTGKMAAIFHMEGAEAIDRDLHALDVFYRAGLRSIGPVWSRDTIFGEGVPFAFPAGPDIGGGLTKQGEKLVAKCNRLGIMIDLSHLNEAGFWDVARLSNAPLVATHSNAHAITPHSRNLTDKQLEAIAESKGLVGLNFATAMLRSDGRMVSDTPLSEMLTHLDHMIGILGEDGVAIGSDFDGATIPEAIKDCAGLPVLLDAMRSHGFGEELIEKLAWKNWVGVLKATWGA
ncbi:MAG: dipeptidase [Pikeienuella sp.]